MATVVTLPKTRYDLLKKRAFLYEKIVRFIPELRWGIEEYSDARIKELMQADRIDRTTQKRIALLLKRTV